MEDIKFLDIAEDFLTAITNDLDEWTSQKGIISLDENSQKATLFTPGHIQFARYGRGPGKQPPVDNILKWVTTNGIIFEGSDKKGTAWAIAKSISKKGTKNWEPNAPDFLDETIEVHIDKYFDEISKRSIEVITTSVDEIYEKEFLKDIEFKI